MSASAGYDPTPSYPPVGGTVDLGLPQPPDGVLAIDGPAALPWETLLAKLDPRRVVDIREHYLPWHEVEARTARAELPGDPVFGKLYDGALSDLFDELPVPAADAIVVGPGSALVPHDVLWYADVPRPIALDEMRRNAVPNIGMSSGSRGSEQRLLFFDWPLEARHRQELAPQLDRYLDLGDADAIRSLDGATLRRTLAWLASRPFRTRPTFLPGPWGGQWLRRTLGIRTEAPNLAWSYELIAPEAGILVDSLEVGFDLLMAAEGARVVGEDVVVRFGNSFPIRFDYLDTLGGGHLSIQCHPTPEYAAATFGLPYTQLESYYVVETTPTARVFLGLRADANVAAFERDARAALTGREFDPERHLQAHEAIQHQLYLIPAGTPHASGAGNVVLEISATPYLYTLRFYDWLRENGDGELRPVHVDHAFANLDGVRRGAAVARDLIQPPTVVRAGPGWAELDLGGLPELFFAVHRLDFDRAVADDTGSRFHVLALVEGEALTIETAAGDAHALAYGETIIVPAAVGAYELRADGPRKVVKAFVK